MDHRYAGGFQPAALVDGPLHADAADHFGAVGVRPDFAAQRFGQFDGEGFGEQRELPQRREGFHARDDRHVDPRFAAAADEGQDAVGVVADLRHDVVGAGVDLGFEVAQVAFGVEGVDVFFGIARHADREFRVVALLHFAVDELAAVHRRDLPHEVDGVGVPLRMGHEMAFVGAAVAAQRQHVVQPEEVHVDERVLDVVARQAAADQVRHHLDAEAVADRGRDAHRAGTPPHPVPLDVAVGGKRLLDALAVEGDVDEGGVEFAQGFDRGEDAAGTVAFERWQQFEREAGRLPCGGFADDIQYVHVQTLFGMIFSTVSTASPRRSA